MANRHMKRCSTWLIIQLSSVTQACLTLCDPMDCSMPGFPVHHQLLEPTQTHVHGVNDAIQTSHPLSSPSPPAFNFFPASGSFPGSSHIRWPKYWSFSFSISPSNEYSLGLTSWSSLHSTRLSRVFFNTTDQKHCSLLEKCKSNLQ